MTDIIKKAGGRKPPKNRVAKGPVHFARDSKTGQYVVVAPLGKASETVTVGRATQKSKHPREFIEEFTKSSVVDNVMRRLSR